MSGGLRQVAGGGAEQVLQSSTARRTLEGRQPRRARTAPRRARKQEGSGLDRRRRTSPSTSAASSPTWPTRSGSAAKLAEKLPPDAGQITILRSNQLKTAQDIAVGIKGLALVLSLLTLLAFGLAIYLSRDGRWVTVLFCGIGLVAAGFAVIVFR